MESATQIMQVFSNFGIVGVLVVFWLIEQKKSKGLEDIIKQMVDTNKRYESLATDLKDVVILNTQAITRVEERLGVLINFVPASKKKKMEAVNG